MTLDQDVTTMINNLPRLLTMIARPTIYDHQEYDIASVFTGLLADAAANVGGPDALLAGRPGSVASDSALVCELRERAHAMVPLPNADICRINPDQ